jgi:hypothetical protein
MKFKVHLTPTEKLLFGLFAIMTLVSGLMFWQLNITWVANEFLVDDSRRMESSMNSMQRRSDRNHSELMAHIRNLEDSLQQKNAALSFTEQKAQFLEQMFKAGERNRSLDREAFNAHRRNMVVILDSISGRLYAITEQYQQLTQTRSDSALAAGFAKAAMLTYQGYWEKHTRWQTYRIRIFKDSVNIQSQIKNESSVQAHVEHYQRDNLMGKKPLPVIVVAVTSKNRDVVSGTETFRIPLAEVKVSRPPGPATVKKRSRGTNFDTRVKVRKTARTKTLSPSH